MIVRERHPNKNNSDFLDRKIPNRYTKNAV